MANDDFEILDRSFENLINTSARVEHLWDQGRWTEGPAYFPALRSLIFSDIPNDRIMRWDETSGTTGVLRTGQNRYTNGNTIDRQGRLVSCEHGTRQVTRTEHDGTITVLVDNYQGKRFNSPNDVVVKSDGSIWFTDPSYGIASNYEGFEAEQELEGCYVFRLDPQSGECRIVADDFVRPNGLAFSPDETRLYIDDSAGTRLGNGERHIRIFDVGDSDTLTGGSIFAQCTHGAYDGFRLDDRGRIWTSADDGVHCLDPDGNLLGKIKIPESVSNVCFGGPKNHRLFITATTSLYSVLLPVTGLRTF